MNFSKKSLVKESLLSGQNSIALKPAWLALRPNWLGLRPAWLALGSSRGDVWIVDVRIYGLTEGKSPILQDFVPYWGAAQKGVYPLVHWFC